MADHRGLVIVDGVTRQVAVGDRLQSAGLQGDDGYDVTISSWSGYAVFLQGNVDLGGSYLDTISFNGYVDSTIYFKTGATRYLRVETSTTGNGNTLYIFGAGGLAAGATNNGGNGGTANLRGGTGGSGAAAGSGYAPGAGGLASCRGGSAGTCSSTNPGGTGGGAELFGGLGGSGNASYVQNGGVGGTVTVQGGQGGGGASGVAPGAGGSVLVTGGSAGSLNTGTGAWGGNVYISGGAGVGTGGNGIVHVGYSNTTNVYIQNATNNGYVQKLGTGDTYWAGNFYFQNNVILGNDTSDTVSYNAKVNTNILPSADNTYKLGDTGQRWSAIYATTVVQGDLGFSDETCLSCGEEFEVGDTIVWEIVSKKVTEHGFEYLSRPKHLNCPQV
jgi:hypothetical protein